MKDYQLYYNKKVIRNLIKKSENYDIVSFDVFDTLLTRVCEDFLYVLKLVDEKLRADGIIIDNFIRKRIDAQSVASARGLYKLHDIYMIMSDFFCLLESDCLQAEDYEVEVEVQICFPIHPMMNILKTLKKKGKTLICISDMHLSRDQMYRIFKSYGLSRFFNKEDMFISCDYGVTKGKGRLFKEVRKNFENGVRILHIGDQWIADYISAKSVHGYDAIKINRIVGNGFYKFTAAREYFDEISKWAYGNVGPVMYGFCKWIKKVADEQGIEDILFLTREGAFFYQIYSIVNNDDKRAKVMYSSRRSIADCSSDLSWKEFVRMIMISGKNICDVLRRFNFCDSEIDKIMEDNLWNKNDKVECLAGFESFLNKYRNKIDLCSKKNRSIFIKYFDSLIQGKNVAIVDIGWAGTSQNLLQKVVNESGKNYNIIGLYFGVLNEQEKDNKKKGYITDMNNRAYNHSLANAGFLLENIFLPNIGQTIGYDNYDEIVIPVMDDFLIMNNDIVKTIQRRIIEFIKNYKQKEEIVNLDENDSIQKMFHFLNYPTRHAAIKLGNIKWTDNGEIRYVAQPEMGGLRYVLDPKKMLLDLKACGWKSGFLRRTFVIPFDYFKVYSLSKF